MLQGKNTYMEAKGKISGFPLRIKIKACLNSEAMHVLFFESILICSKNVEVISYFPLPPGSCHLTTSVGHGQQHGSLKGQRLDIGGG